VKIHFWSIGKSHDLYVKLGIETFSKRISHYYNIEWKIISSGKSTPGTSIKELKKNEGENILKLLDASDVLVVLDEKGKELSSEKLAELIQLNANKSTKNLVFLIGGAYGIDQKIIDRANFIWSLSPLVFPHQLVRLILAEQVYRACTIIKNEKYHHT
jgi:23S rRNA (pseudouridine1915-N3)-methyltransferase